MSIHRNIAITAVGHHMLKEMVGTPSGATFSGDRKRRRHLWRCWDQKLPRLGWLCLNPSTADESLPDASVRKMAGFALRLGYGAIDVVNLFDWRTKSPAVLRAEQRPTTKENDGAILVVALHVRIMMCAWGRHGSHLGRDAEVLAMLKEAGHAAKLRLLRMNIDGSPAHPLMLPWHCQPAIYKEAAWPTKK